MSMKSREHHGQRHAGAARRAVAATPSPGKRTLTDELGAGEALPSVQRRQFEQSLGRDLSGVRVHTGDAAAEHAAHVKAHAFATGQDIVFGKGAYNPFDRRSMHLLAHEVAHTAQQQGTAPAGELATTQPGDAVERDADSAAAAMLAGKPAQVSAQPVAIARRALDESVELPGGTSDDQPSDGDAEIGELTAERVGQEPDEGDDEGLDVPVRDTEAGTQEIAAIGQQLPSDGGAGDVAGAALQPGPEPGGGVGEGGDEEGTVSPEVAAAIAGAQSDALAAIEQSEVESAAYKAEMNERRDRFEAEQNALMLEQLRAMSPTEKRQTLLEMGYDARQVRRLRDAELDGIIEGRVTSEQRKTRILGMTPEELAALSPAQKIQFLVDLGIDREDLDKVGQARAARLFDDVMRVAHVPGQHRVRIRIRGGLFGKSWEVTVRCDAEGNTDIHAEERRGFLSRLWGWIKAAIPIVLSVLGPLTAGASMVALAVLQTAMAIKNGDWLGAIAGVATAVVGITTFIAALKGTSDAARVFANIASVASRVKRVAEAAQAAMAAVQARNAGSLLGALARGAAAFAAVAGDTANRFEQTMQRWAERLDYWARVISGGQRMVQGIRRGDPIAALGGAFDAAAAAVGGRATPTGRALTRASSITGFVNAGRAALRTNPPDYAAVADAALRIAGQLTEDRRFDDAGRIVSRAHALKQAWDRRESDPTALIEAALSLAQAVEVARYDLQNEEKKDANGDPLPDAERDEITARYERARNTVRAASDVITAATARPRPNYLAALDAATRLIAELTDSRQIDAAARVTTKLDGWTAAINSRDENAIRRAAEELGAAINELRDVISNEQDEARKAAQAQLPPGATLPDEPCELPPGPTPEDIAGAATDASGTPRSSQITHPSTAPDDNQPGPTGEPRATTDPQAPPLRFEETVTVTAPAPPPRFEETVTVTTRAPLPPIPPDVQRAIDIIEAFTKIVEDLGHPGARYTIGLWEAQWKLFEKLRSDNATTTDAYRDVLAGLAALHASGEFLDAVAREFRLLERAFGDPFDAATTRASLQEIGRLKRNLGRLVRAGAIPQTFLEAADNVVVACGYKKDLSGAEATVAERLVAAANLAYEGAKLHTELTWLAAVAARVMDRLREASPAAAINAVRNGLSRFGNVAAVVLRWVTPMLEKVAAMEGTQAAMRIAERIVVELTALGAAFEVTKATPQVLREIANRIAGRIGFVFRFSLSPATTIAVMLAEFEWRFADELYSDAYNGIAELLSPQVFGRPINQIKNEIRSYPVGTAAECDAFFDYAFHRMLIGATAEIRGGWLPYAHQELQHRIVDRDFRALFPQQPVRALQSLRPDYFKTEFAAPALQDIASTYLDIAFDRHRPPR